MSNRWSRIEAALSDEISNDSLRGRSVCCIAVCVSAWCQLSSVCLPGASWALTLATVSIWLSTGACCVPVTDYPVWREPGEAGSQELVSPYTHGLFLKLSASVAPVLSGFI